MILLPVSLSLIFSFLLLFNGVWSFSYSVLLQPHEPKLCFYVRVKEPRTPLHIYYSINEAKLSADSGKLLDLQLFGAKGELLRTVDKKGSGDLTVEAGEPGEYAACFQRVDVSPSRLVVDVDVSLGRSQQAKADAAKSPTAPLEEANEKLVGNLEDLLQSYRYMKNRKRRNEETVKEARSRLFYLSSVQTLLIAGMTFLQIFVVRTLFNPSRRPRV
jgi:hypothetical protein